MVTLFAMIAALFFLPNSSLPAHADAPVTRVDDSVIDSPARIKPPVTDWARVQRKPAVEPRVYIESASSKTGFVYYDYADQQVPPVSQQPPQR